MSLCLPAAAPQAGAPGPCTCVLSQPAGKGSPSLRCGLLRTRAGARVGSRLPGQMVPADGVTRAPAKGRRRVSSSHHIVFSTFNK